MANSRERHQNEDPVVVPHHLLSPEVLRALVEEFVTREGTDYGAQEKSLEEKVSRVMDQLADGRAKVVFDASSQTPNIVPADELK